MGKKSSYRWGNRQGNTEHDVIISARDINGSLPGIHCAVPVATLCKRPLWGPREEQMGLFSSGAFTFLGETEGARSIYLIRDNVKWLFNYRP